MLINGNAAKIPLADGTVQCVVTSPIYWGLRDYGVRPLVFGGVEGCVHRWGEEINNRRGAGGERDYGSYDGGVGRGPAPVLPASQFCQLCNAWRGSLGLEPTPDLYVDHLVSVFREVRRVLRDDGVVWLNLGDSYASQGGGQVAQTKWQVEGASATQNSGKSRNVYGTNLKPKDLVGIPWRVAFALQADGWWLRSDVIWHKPNCMPESVTDRPTKAHEYLFLLTKSARYYYDAEAVREPMQGAERILREAAAGMNKELSFKRDESRGDTDGGMTHSQHGARLALIQKGGRNRRTVWTIPTQSYKGAHFATFPEKLVEPCILAGTSARGECPVCGKGWIRVVEAVGERQKVRGAGASVVDAVYGTVGKTSVLTTGEIQPKQTTGWRPQCAHYPCVDEWQEYPRQDTDESDADYDTRTMPIEIKRKELLELWRPLKTIPQTVLDIFAGTATVGRVATQHRRAFVGLELNPEYIGLAGERTRNVAVRLGL